MATIKDVAKRAGVAPSTVSYALSGERPISAAVQRRVRAAVEELGYLPSALGRNLRHGNSQNIGMVYPLPPSLSDELGLDFIGAAAEVIHDRYTLSLFTHVSEPQALLEAFRKQRVDGLIIMQTTRYDPRVEALRETKYPFALIGRTGNTEGLSLVDFDYEAAAYVAIGHLVELGHRYIGYIDIPTGEHDAELGYVYYLYEGYRRACRDFDVTILRQEAGSGIEAGQAASHALLAACPELTAVVALLGTTHLGVLRALHSHGRRVPEDVSVVCLSTASKAEWTTPRLTSVDSPLAEMGRTGAELLLRRIAGDLRPQRIIFPARLTVRESTAPPPAS